MNLAAGIRRVVIPLIILTIIGVALAPLSPRTPDSRTAGSDDFTRFMEPRLAALLESSRTVEGMVSERSRNVLALRAEGQRIETIVVEIDTYLESAEIPEWAESLVQQYQDGSAKVLTAIEAAYDAIRRFDFSAIPDMIPVFSEGTSEIDAALRSLRDHEESASSYTGLSVT